MIDRIESPDHGIAACTMPILTASRRGDGWTGERQRAFCEAVAQGNTVADACRMLGLSTTSAYAFRSTARGAAFAIGWSAAQLLQRHRLADELAQRALQGQTAVTTLADGSQVERHVFDNRLAMAVLARLDRQAAAADAGQRDAGDSDGHAARAAAAEFDRYLDLLAGDAAPARAAMFIALRHHDAAAPADLAAIARLGRADLYVRTAAGLAAEIDVADLDIAARADWTAAQWARAEAAGLVSLDAPAPPADAAAAPDDPAIAPQLSQHWGLPPEPAWANDRVWLDTGGWLTDFPPPSPFHGREYGDYGEEDYARELSDEEAALLDRRLAADRRELAEADEPERCAWLATLATGEDPPDAAAPAERDRAAPA